MSIFKTWFKRFARADIRMVIFVLSTLGLLLVSIMLILFLGHVDISWSEILRILWSGLTGTCVDCQDLHRDIILNIRLPRIIAAVLVGGGLALSGAVLQTVTRNNLADPYLFGISSAGAFGGTLALVYLQASLGSVEFYLCVFLAVMLSLGLLLQLVYYFRVSKITYILLGGVALGYVWQGLQSYILIYSPQEAIYVWSWQNGGLVMVTWPQIFVGFMVIALIAIFLYQKAAVLDVLAFGTESAVILGIDVPKYRLLIMFLCGIVIGLVVTMVGLISFVGLVIPHMVRYMLRSSLHRYLIPCSLLLGALSLVWFDFIARMIGGIYEVSVNTVSSFFGALFFLVLLINMYRSQKIS